MKTNNSIYCSVFVNKQVSLAAELNYQDAKNNMILMCGPHFDTNEDDAIIFEMNGLGEAKPIFNYRAFLNNEEQPEPIPGKENPHFKYIFQCPKCLSSEGKLKVDEDGDIIIECCECSHKAFAG